jgi:hypothetical protein
MEFIPLALAIIVLLKVEASHADGNTDLEYYRNKLAEHCHRNCNRTCDIAPESVHKPTEHYREAGQAVDGSVRRKKS